MGNLELDIRQSKFESELSKSLINLFYTSNHFGAQFASLLKPYQLTTPQFNILRILRGQHPEPCTVNLLIERMLDKSSNASRIVDKLESKELVIRKQCTDDRRAVDVLISPKGLEVLRVLDAEMEQFRNSTRQLTEEESKELNRLLDKMRG